MGRLQLQTLLEGAPGVKKVYFQPPSSDKMEFPCILYVRDQSFTRHANNKLYLLKKRYTVTVIDRDPDSAIPDFVEALPYSSFNRFFVTEGLNHFVFQVFF